MTVTIRTATPRDAAVLATLNDEIQYLHATEYPDDFVYPADAGAVAGFFDRLLTQDQHQILLAGDDGQDVGYLWFERQSSKSNPFRHPFERLLIHHVFVRRSHRRLGVARALIEHAKATPLAAGYTEIALDSWSNNTKAHSFFENLGFEVYRLNMRAKL